MATPTIFTPIAIDPVQLTASAATYLTAGANGAILDYILLLNTDTAARTANVWYIESGGTGADKHLLCKGLVIPTGGIAINVLEMLKARPFHMEGGGFIQALADVTTKVNIHIGGTDFA